MLDFNDIIDEILKTPPRSPPHLPPLPQPPPPPPPPTPFAPSAPAGLVLAPLGRLSRPSCRSPVASSGDIWDVPSSDEVKEEKEEQDGDAPADELGYVIQHTNAVFNDYS